MVQLDKYRMHNEELQALVHQREAEVQAMQDEKTAQWAQWQEIAAQERTDREYAIQQESSTGRRTRS
eukprot:10528451-Heterocapsa_arctica.AAC.1